MNLALPLFFSVGFLLVGFPISAYSQNSTVSDKALANPLAETSIEAFELSAPCGEDVAKVLTDMALEVADKIGVACEKRNQNSPPSIRCPFQTCLGEFRNGGYAAPTMEIRIGNSPSSTGTGMGMGYPGSSSSSTEKIYISTTLKFSLAKDPDKVVCFGTLSPAVTTPLFTSVLAEVAKSPVCKK
jgi:hypothetical protein